MKNGEWGMENGEWGKGNGFSSAKTVAPNYFSHLA